MRYAIAAILLLFSVAVFGQLDQFRMVGSGSWSVVDDSTYSATVTFASDLTANSFLPTGVVDSMRVFTQRGQLYTIDSVGAKTFSTAVIYAVEYGGDWGSPSGQVLVYETRGRETVPAIPFATNGATSKLQEAVVTHNAAINNGVSTTQLADSTTAAKTYTNNQIASVAPVKDTIVQASHGFSVGDPIWYSGDYLLSLDTGLTVRVDGVISAVPDINTFVLQRTGRFTLTSHGFTVGVQLYVQPDGSYSVIDTSNALVYGYPIDANTIEIGLKGDQVSVIAEKFNSSFSGLPSNKSQALDTLSLYRTIENFDALLTQISSFKEGQEIRVRETGSKFLIQDSSPITADSKTVISVGGGLYAVLQGDINLLDYNFTYGKTADSTICRNNRTELNTLISSAISLGKNILVPADTISMKNAIGSSVFFQPTIPSNNNRTLSMLGVSKETSVFYFPNYDDFSVVSLNIFRITVDINTRFENLTFQGPDNIFAPQRTGTYSISSGNDTLTYVSGQDFAAITDNTVTDSILNRYIYLAGAGASGDTLRAYVTEIIDANTVVLSDTAQTTVAGASGYWYSSWQQGYLQNSLYSHLGNTYVQMGSGKSMTGYPGKSLVTATGFTWDENIEGGVIWAKWDGTNKAQKYFITKRVSSTEVLIGSTIDENLTGNSINASSSDSWYQLRSSIIFSNVNIKGNFRNGISIEDGIQDIQILNTDISTYETALGVNPDHSVIKMLDQNVVMNNSRVYDSGIQYRGDGNIHPEDGNGRLVYGGEGTGWQVVNCRFEGKNYRTGFSTFGGGTTGLDTFELRPITLTNCYFEAGLRTAWQTGTYQDFSIVNCEMKSPVEIFGSTTVLGSTLDFDYLNPNTLSNATAENINPILIRFADDRRSTFNWIGGEVIVKNTSLPVVSNFTDDEPDSKQWNRNVKFSNVTFEINKNSTSSTASSGFFFLGNDIKYAFDNCTFHTEMPDVTTSIFRFQNAGGVRIENCDVYHKNPTNAQQRLIYIADVGDVSSFSADSFRLEHIYIRGLNFKHWDTDEYVFPGGQLAELVRLTENTEIDTDIPLGNSSFYSVNATSTAAGFDKYNHKRESVWSDMNLYTHLPSSYGSGSKGLPGTKTGTDYILGVTTDDILHTYTLTNPRGGSNNIQDVLDSLHINPYSGWADYTDTTYTSASPFSLTASNKVTLPNNADVIRDSQMPIDIDSMYNRTDTLITGRNGDGLNVLIEFKVKPTTAAVTKISVTIDIGGSVGEIYPRDFILTKGNGVEHYYLSSFGAYTLDTWETNGGKVKIVADAAADVYDIRYVLTRTHKAR